MLKLKLQYFGHLMRRANSLERTPMLGKAEGRRRRGRQRMRWLDGIIDSMDEFQQTVGDSEGQGSLAGCSPWGHKESDMTEQLNNNRPVPPDSLEHRGPHSHAELPQAVLKANSFSSTGFNLCRSRW